MPTPVTANVPLEPLAIVTLDGMVTIPEGVAVRLMTTPPGGAGLDSVTAPLTVRVRPTVLESSVTEMPAGEVLTVALPFVKPVAVARINALPAAAVDVTLTVALVEFSGIVTLAGTAAIVVSLLISFTCTPPGPAGLPSVIVSAADELVAMLSGFGVSVMLFNPAVIVTVFGSLLVNPS